MNNSSSILSRFFPLWLFLLLLISYSAYNSFSLKSYSTLVQSDGRGYYAYLPAVVTYSDPDFSETLKAEKKYHPQSYDPYFLYRTADNKTYNKYFPGVAVLQLPFYLIATFLAMLFGLPADGYSAVYMICYFIGSTFYAACSIFMIFRLFRKLLPDSNPLKLQALIMLVLLSGPVIYYGFITFYYSQVHSLFMFSCCAATFYNFSVSGRKRWLYLFAFCVGLIFIIRPTNIIFLAFLPVLLPGKEKLTEVFKRIFTEVKSLLLPALLIFLSVAFILFLGWKWQTGKWFVWNYNGEGFNFLHPEFWSTLFSFRIGIFLQIPVFFLIIAGLYFLYRENRYKAFWWSLYFFLNVYVMAAWWCWDFESQFSIRPLTEHFFFLTFPLISWLSKPGKWKVSLLVFFAALNLLRFYELQTGFMGDQRFTSSSYFASLNFRDKENEGRWNFTLSCKPFGKVTAQKILVDQQGEEEITPAKEFALTGIAQLSGINSGKLYYRISLEKKLLSAEMKELFVVIDATGRNGKHNYSAIELFNDRKEERDQFKPLVFEGLMPDNFNEIDSASIYIWNPGKNHVVIKNMKAVIENYGK